MNYRLHSSTSLSLTVWGQLTAQWQHLALCFSFVKIWLHWITITTSTSCLLRSHPCPYSPILPLPILCPQSNPSSWILSEWHPLNLPNYLSSGQAALGCTFFSRGGATGAKGTSTGLPYYWPKTPRSPRHPQPFTVKFKRQSQVTERLFYLELRCIKNCLQGLQPRSNLALLKVAYF